MEMEKFEVRGDLF